MRDHDEATEPRSRWQFSTICCVFNWWLALPFLVLSSLRVSMQGSSYAIGFWMALAIFLIEISRVYRIYKRVSSGASNSQVKEYFRHDAARRWFSVRDSVAGINALVTRASSKGEQDVDPNA